MYRALLYCTTCLLLILGPRSEAIATGPDTAKLNLLMRRSRELLFKPGAVKQDIDSASFYANQAYKLAAGSGNTTYEGKILLLEALLSNKNEKRDEGMIQTQKALSIFEKNKDIRNVAEAYIMIAQHYKNNSGQNIETKIRYYQKAIEIFTALNDFDRQATVYQDLAGYQQLINNINGALSSLRKALHAGQLAHHKDLQGIYDLMGACLSTSGDYVDGLRYGLLAIKAAETVRDTTLQLCTIYNRVGKTYFYLRDYNHARTFYLKSYAIAKHYKDTSSEIALLNNIANLYTRFNRPSEALPVLDQLSKLARATPNDPEKEYNIQYAYAKVYLEKKDFFKANPAISVTERIVTQYSPPPVIQARTLSLRIEYLMGKKNYNACYPLLFKMQSLCKQANSIADLGGNELLWFQTDSALNRYPSAVNHYQRYKAAMDSVFTMGKNLQTDMLNIEFDTERKDKDIQLKSSRIEILNKQALLQESRVERAGVMKNVMLGGSSCLLIILGLGYNRYRLKIKSNRQLEEKQTEIVAKNRSLEKLLQENEWLLREVHHRVKNNLQIIISLLHSQTVYLKDEKALRAVMESQHRVQAMSLIHQKLYKTTNTSAVYMPEYIRDLLYYLKDSFKIGAGILIEDDIESITLDVSQAVPIGLIINELITNAFKYAFPCSEKDLLFVRFAHVSNLEVELEISDNGKGLPADFSEHQNSSFGMILIRGLTDELEGCLDVKSGYGTTVTTRFKLNRMRAA